MAPVNVIYLKLAFKYRVLDVFHSQSSPDLKNRGVTKSIAEWGHCGHAIESVE